MTYKIWLLVFLFPGLAKGQFIFQNLRTTDGLSNKMIRCLYKDSEGFLWIGTAKGLNRFDGAFVRQYKSESGFKDLFINAIQPLNENEIVIGTREGIRVFNKREGAFKPDKRFAALRDKEITTIKPDGYNRLWIVAKSGMYIYKGGRLIQAKEQIPDAKIFSGGKHDVSVLAWDAKRLGFWVGGRTTFFIDCKNQVIYDKLKNPGHYPLLDSENVHAIAVDKDFNVWYGSNNDKSLNFWNYKTNQIETHYDLDGKRIFGGCNFLFCDKKNRLWISTWAYSAYIKEPDQPIKKIPYSQNRTYSIGYGFLKDIIEDADGNVWLGTINGISKVQANAPVKAIYQLPSFEYFLQAGFAHSNSIVVDKQNIMASKEEGMVLFNMDKRTYKRYVVTHGTDYVRNRFLMSVKHQNTWWCAGIDGIYCLRPGSESLESFEKIKYRSARRYANFIFTDQSDNIWFQIWDDAIYRYKPQTGKLERFDGTNSHYGEFQFANSSSFLVQQNGNILFAVNGLGFLKFDVTAEKFSVLPVQDSRNFVVNKLVEDKSENIWGVVWGRGIIKADRNGVIFDSLNTSNGFPYDHLSSIAIDDFGSIWVSGSEGLMFIKPGTRAQTKVDVDLGQNLQDYWNNLYVANHKMYAVMLDHVVEIDPSKFAEIKVEEAPHITSVKVFGNEIDDFGKDSELDLRPDEDYLTFQYASLDHRDVPSLRYSYILEGFDQKWISAGRSLIASYKNLPWGKYTFKVRSTDEHGNWMKEAGALKIYIWPPWWQTSWFLTLAAVTFFISIILLYRAMVKRQRKLLMETSIDYFANSVYGISSVSEICWDIARNCISLLHFEDCVVYLMDYKKNVLVQKAAYGSKNPKGQEIDNPIEIPLGKGIVGAVAVSGKPLIISNTSRDPRYIVDEERRFSELSVPILHDGKVLGVVDSEHSKKNYFKFEHLKALTIITSISASKIAEALAQVATQQKEFELMEINKMLAESQLMALRAQMNPHFVFNCLNSIQECIVTEKFGEASKYLNLFSKLFRKVLNNSGKNLVTIEEEREVLELYLQLEAMRFERSFSYKIVLDEELDEEEILIPSMLIQPYVENALWHGLMHSRLERRLSIVFKKIDENTYECRIDDNGIGRKKSFEIKAFNSKTKHHESKGLRISNDRLSVLKRQGQHATVEFIDKENANGEATGTLVIVQLSTYLK